MSADARWTVERPAGGENHDVGAARAVIEPSGALAFYDSNDRLVVAYSPTRWTEVWEQ